MNKIFIGYDDNATIAYHVCVNSIIRNTTSLVSITPLSLQHLPYKETHNDGSNTFIYSRFLVPFINNFNEWAIFIDGDMILKSDITDLFNFNDTSKAVYVVKHSYQSTASIKYLGAKNENYPRKNWSSVIVWNCAHPKHRMLTPEFIQSSTGEYLHRFTWLNDDEIGELPIEWNWLPDEFGSNNQAKLLHFTLGTPCFTGYEKVPMAEEWFYEHKLTNYCLTATQNQV